jgi:hypothetical protein
MARKPKPFTAKDPEGDDRLTTHTTFRLPRDLHQRLLAAAGERGIGEEIRRRLEASFTPGTEDPKTRELAGAVAKIASAVSSYYRPWHENRHAFDAVRAAVALLMASYQPKGDPVPTPNDDDLADLLWGPNHCSDEVAKTLATSVIRELREGR